MAYKERNRKDPTWNHNSQTEHPMQNKFNSAIDRYKKEKKRKEISDMQNQGLYYDICVNKK